MCAGRWYTLQTTAFNVPQSLLNWGGGNHGIWFTLGHGGLRGRGALVRSVQYSSGFNTINVTLAEVAGGQWLLKGEWSAGWWWGRRETPARMLVWHSLTHSPLPALRLREGLRVVHFLSPPDYFLSSLIPAKHLFSRWSCTACDVFAIAPCLAWKSLHVA